MNTDQAMHLTVDTFMCTPVLTIDQNATVQSAATALRNHDIGTLVVTSGTAMAGIISERDLVGIVADGTDARETPVAAIMSSDPRYLTAGEEVEAAMDEMLTVGVRHLPVLDEGELVGMVSMRNLMDAVRA